MIYYTTGSTDAPYNLAFEQYLFDTLSAGQSALGLWQNRSAVIVGKHQNTAEEIDAAYVRDHGIQIVRRMSGGGAVYHDLGNINFTYITDQPEGKRLDFAFFAQPVIEALAALGVASECTGRNDLCIGGRKFSGNAQYLRGGRVLHHGTLLYNADLGMITRALRVPADKLAAKGVASVASRVTNIAEHLTAPMPLDAFYAHLQRYLNRENELIPYAPTPEDLAAIDTLRAKRYVTWDWNWGASPRYNVRRQIRFAGGGMTAYMQVESGILSSVALHGDFFATGDLGPLMRALTGVALDRISLAATLAPLNDLSAFIHGLDAETLINLLLSTIEVPVNEQLNF